MTDAEKLLKENENIVRTWRGINGELCKSCRGWGKYLYSNTATYHDSEMSGQAMTWDVCDSCWGSGEKDKPWPSHKLICEAIKN